MQTNSSAQSQASYNRWTWVVALILALILLWMLLTGRGPTNDCCTLAEPAVAAAEPPVEVWPVAPEITAFSFTATQNAVNSTGNTANIAWLAQSDQLKMLLSGDDLRAEGDANKVLLSGTVDSESIKIQKGVDALVLFGSSVTIDNQLTVKVADSSADENSPPAAVKLYFDTGKTTLPNDADSNLAEMIEWLKAHPEAKAVLSGYHDPSGNKAANEKLAKRRAESVEDALEAAGIDDDRIDKRKPQTVDGGTDLAEARRVEVSIE